LVLALHDRDWERLAAFGDQVNRLVAHGLSQREDDDGEWQQDAYGADGHGNRPGVALDSGDDGSGDHRGAGPPLGC
jgi:hypothetical protein